MNKTYSLKDRYYYTPLDAFKNHDGLPGELGIPVNVPASKADISRRMFDEYQVNVFVSDMVSVNRSLPETRNLNCSQISYPDRLPKCSVVMVFHNEPWTILFRSIHSVLNRSPPELLEEIILIDDFSDKLHLRVPLDEYWSRMPAKVKLFRTEKRQGLIRARVIGAKQAKVSGNRGFAGYFSIEKKIFAIFFGNYLFQFVPSYFVPRKAINPLTLLSDFLKSTPPKGFRISFSGRQHREQRRMAGAASIPYCQRSFSGRFATC